jgi:hypothetical protein
MEGSSLETHLGVPLVVLELHSTSTSAGSGSARPAGRPDLGQDVSEVTNDLFGMVADVAMRRVEIEMTEQTSRGCVFRSRGAMARATTAPAGLASARKTAPVTLRLRKPASRTARASPGGHVAFRILRFP